MNPRLKIVIGCVLLVMVVAICIAPFVDLEPTTMQAGRAAYLAFLSIPASATVIIGLFHPGQYFATLPAFAHPAHVGTDLTDFTCARLC